MLLEHRQLCRRGPKLHPAPYWTYAGVSTLGFYLTSGTSQLGQRVLPLKGKAPVRPPRIKPIAEMNPKTPKYHALLLSKASSCIDDRVVRNLDWACLGPVCRSVGRI